MSHIPKLNMPYHPSLTLPYHPRIHLPYHPYHPGLNIPFHSHSMSPLPISSLSPSSPSSTSSSSSGHNQITPSASGHGFRGMKSKICGVCGDRAKSYHFGGISCDSCKAFFRRSVQNDAYKNFHCPYEAQCDINISSRKCCQFCRFKKCLSIGMEKSWVMTEEERLQMLKARLEKRQKQESMSSSSDMASPSAPTRSSPQSTTSPSQVAKVATSDPPQTFQLYSNSTNFLHHLQVRTIENLVNHYIVSCQEIPLRFPPVEDVGTNVSRVDDGDIRPDKHLGDERPHHFSELNGLKQEKACSDENVNESQVLLVPTVGDSGVQEEEERVREMKRLERKKRRNDDEQEDDDDEKTRTKKKSTSSSSASSSPVITSSLLQESRQSVSSSCESINIISVDDEEEEEQIVEGKEESTRSNTVKEEKESDEGNQKNERKILMNEHPNDVNVMFRLSKETNGGRSENHNHIVHPVDEDESDLLNSSNSSTSSSTFSSSSWGTINSNTSTNFDLDREPRQSKAKILEILFTSVQQLTSFSKKIKCFSQLTSSDQGILLKGCILEMCLIRSAACFDPKTNSWPDPSETIKSLMSFGTKPGANGAFHNGVNSSPSKLITNSYDSHGNKVNNEKWEGEERKATFTSKKKGTLSIFDVRPLMSQELFLKYTKFIKSIQGMKLDQISVIILCIVLLLCPDRTGLSQSSIEFITRQHEKYLLLLQSYMVWKYGDTVSSVLFPKLLLKLPDLRELSELLTDYQLVLCKEEVQSVQNQLQQQLIISSPREDRFRDD